jgi:hypothetical protein
MGHKVGSYVSMQFSSADASTIATISLYDADGVAVTLKANERLVIDSAVFSVATAAGNTTFADDFNSSGTIGAGELICELSDGVVNMQGGDEGRACSIGKVPKVKAAAAGQVSLTGTGRIVAGKTEGLRPSWRETIVPGT